METMRSGHVKEREGLDDGTVKLKDELRQTRAERNQLELSKHELEAVSQSKHELEAVSQSKHELRVEAVNER